MDLQKINVKFFVNDPDAFPLDRFIPLFNAWIQASDGEYYDIADYSHVPAGPGIVLVAHEANVSMDNGGNRLGLLYSRKGPLQGPNGEKLRWTFKAALEYCRRIEEEPALQGRLRFRGDEALLLINDRLLAPNSEKTFLAVRPDLEHLARALYGGADFVLEPDTGDPRRRFSVHIRASASFDVVGLFKNLEEQRPEVGARPFH